MDAASRHVALTNEEYGYLLHTLSQIATGCDTKYRRLTREKMVTDAREVCDTLGWRYGKDYLLTREPRL